MTERPVKTTALRVAIVGGGIAGLAAAHRLTDICPQARLALFESSARLGGVIETEELDGFLIERSADSFITFPAGALELCRRIGFESELIGTNQQYRGAYVVHRGRLVKLPEGFTLMSPARLGPVLATPLLSWAGKLRLGAELLLPRRRDPADESFASFARRRLGREAYERLAQPLVAGIYTADPEKLSMQAALPRFVELERRYGSLYRGMRRAEARSTRARESGARYNLFVTPRRGLSSLIAALAAQLPSGSVRLSAAIRSLSPAAGNRWRLTVDGPSPAEHEFDAIILAVGSPMAAAIAAGFDSSLATELRAIQYAGCVIAILGYRRQQIAHPLDAFGLVVPEVEKRPILAVSFSSVKFPDRAPRDCVLLRVFLGGACHTDLHQLDDGEIRRLVLSQLAELLGAQGEPGLFRIARWDNAMPQYHLGHCERVGRIQSRLNQWPALALAGNAYSGIGIPLCVASGETAAERIVDQLAANCR